MGGNALVNWSKVGAHSVPGAQERFKSSSNSSSSNLLDTCAKVGIRKKARRRIPSPKEWIQMKDLLEEMEIGQVGIDCITCSLLLTACSDLQALEEGKRVHELIKANDLQKLDPTVENNVIQMYIRCGCMDRALDVFASMQKQDAVAWTSLVSAFTRNGHCKQALLFFRKMLLLGVSPDRVTFVTIFNTVGALGSLSDAKFVHRCVADCGMGSDAIVGTAVLGMYSKCGSFEDAREAFRAIKLHDRISWTAMITACAENSRNEEAVVLFHRMVLEGEEMSDITLASALNTCEVLREGKMMHRIAAEKGFEKEMVVGTALVTMYGNCGQLQEAKLVFDSMNERDVVLWTAMIAVYVECGEFRDAFKIFREMQRFLRPNKVTFLTLVNACAEKSALPEARELHRRIGEEGVEDSFTGSAVVAMYGRCGSVVDARRAFEEMKAKKCAISWNSIIAVLANNGEVHESLELLRRMLQEGIEANRVTFISVLSMCGHAGMVKEACQWFVGISDDFMATPSIEHFSCVSDMLGRAGWLEEAESLVRKMPCEADDGIWVSLLGACRTYGDVERSERVAMKVLELQPQNSEAYVVLCNSLKTGPCKNIPTR